MTSGILVNKRTRRRILGFKNEDRTSEEIIEAFGLKQYEPLEFIELDKLEIPLEDIRDWHKISSDGSVEDTRKVAGYRYELGKEIRVKGETIITSREVINTKKKLSRDEEKKLEAESGKKILRITPKKR